MIQPIDEKEILGNSIQEASIIYPNREFRVIKKCGKGLSIKCDAVYSRVNIEVDCDDRIISIRNYG